MALGNLAGIAQLLQTIFGSPTTTQSTSANTGALQQAQSTAAANANNPLAVMQPVVNNAMNQAAMNFAQTQQQQNTSGIYDSATSNLLSSYAQAQAAAQAAASVANYSSQQGQISASAANDLAQNSRTVNTSTQGMLPSSITNMLPIAGAGMLAYNNGRGVLNAVSNPSQALQGTMLGDALGINGASTSSAGVPLLGNAPLGSTAASQAADSMLVGTPSNAGFGASQAAAQSPAFLNTGLAQVLNPTSATGAGAALGTDITAGAGSTVGGTVNAAGQIAMDTNAAGFTVPSAVAADGSAAGAGSGILDTIGSGLGDAGSAIGAGLSAAASTVGDTLAAGAGAVGDAAAAGASVAGDAAATIGSFITDALPAIVASLICTALTEQKRIPRGWWWVGSLHFNRTYSYVAKKSYWMWAKPAARHVRAKPHSWLSNSLAFVFYNRAEYIAAECNYPGAKATSTGLLALWLVSIITAIVGVVTLRWIPEKCGTKQEVGDI